MAHPFGLLLTQYRMRKFGLTQARLAELAGYDPAIIARMCQGKKDLTGPSGRERVVRIIHQLWHEGVLSKLDEANALLEAADFSPLYDGSPDELVLMRTLQSGSASLVQETQTVHVVSRAISQSNLPGVLTSFIGREREIAELVDLVKSKRLITLTGAGGCGKSRLALELGIRLQQQHEFLDGVWLVELASLVDGQNVPRSVANIFGLADQPGDMPIDVVLREHLASKQLLLVLDNCEHLIASCAEFAERLLERGPGIHLLATSREALQIGGEIIWRVPSLTTPGSATEVAPIEVLRGFEAVRLFEDRAREALPSFELTYQNSRAVAAICRQLDGIPLAIELAAIHVRVLSVEDISTRLVDRFRLLTAGHRTALRRHHTLHGMLDWSYELLTSQEKVLLARVSIFCGGWTAEAAEYVCADRPDSTDASLSSHESLVESDILPLLFQLVNKSLVIVEHDSKPPNGHTRYYMLETIRQYAAERLSASNELDKLSLSHLEYFFKLAQQGEQGVQRTDPIEWAHRLLQEHDNIRAALAWSLEHESEMALRLAGVMGMFWWIRGYWAEGRTWLERALDRAQSPSADAQAHALIRLGRIIYYQDRSPNTISIVARGLSFAKQAGNLSLIADGYAGLGVLTLEEPHKLEEGLAFLEESIEWAKKANDSFIHYSALVIMARKMLGLGNVQRAQQLSEEIVNIARISGESWGITIGLAMKGIAALLQGEYDIARSNLEESIDGQLEIAHTPESAWSRIALGLVMVAQGDYSRAYAWLAETLLALAPLNVKYLTAFCLSTMGLLASRGGDYRRAVLLLSSVDYAHLREFERSASTFEQIQHDAAVSEIRGRLDKEVFAALWAEGKSMTLEQATTYALSTN